MDTHAKTGLKSVLVLMSVALITAVTLSALNQSQSDRIADNQRAFEMRQIRQLLADDEYDNDPYQDLIWVNSGAPDAQLLGSGERHYIARATQQQRPAAAVMQATTDQGYSGKIELMVGVYANGELAGVRISAHRETPGLGDQIERSRTDWLDQLVNRSLRNPEEAQWHVKKDGGEFDQITGATVTSRAVVEAVKNALIYFESHRTEIFAQTAQTDVEGTAP